MELSVFGQSNRYNYAQKSSWFLFPDSAEILEEPSFDADVFFVHPTTYFRPGPDNQPDQIQSEMRRLNHIVANQVSVFEADARIFMPLYAQAALKLFLRGDSSRLQIALDRAYEDVRTSFEYYLEHFNKGRPIILAAHSQGSYHAMRLLKDYMDKEYYSQLVVAYVVGIPLSEQHFSDFKHISLCHTETQTGCIAGWMTIDGKTGIPSIREKSFSLVGDKMQRSSTLDLVNVNPISWRTDSALAHGSPLQIAMPNTGKGPMRVSDRTLSARSDNGFVRVYGHERGIFNGPLGNLHIYDYNLFHMNIMDNVEIRLRFYLSEPIPE